MAHTEQSSSKLSKDDLARLVLDYQGKFDSVKKPVKACVCYFFINYFSPNDGPLKAMKNAFYLI